MPISALCGRLRHLPPRAEVAQVVKAIREVLPGPLRVRISRIKRNMYNIARSLWSPPIRLSRTIGFQEVSYRINPYSLSRALGLINCTRMFSFDQPRGHVRMRVIRSLSSASAQITHCPRGVGSFRAWTHPTRIQRCSVSGGIFSSRAKSVSSHSSSPRMPGSATLRGRTRSTVLREQTAQNLRRERRRPLRGVKSLVVQLLSHLSQRLSLFAERLDPV